MRKKLLLIIILIPVLIYSQSIKNDSLTKLLNTSKSDSLRIGLFIKLSNNLAKKDSITKFSYADSALLLSDKLDNVKYRAMANKNMAALFQSYDKEKEAVSYYKQALILFSKFGNRAEQAYINFELGILMYHLDDFQESINYHQKSLDIRYGLNDTFNIFESEQALGVMYWRLGDFKNAEKHYLLSLSLAENRIDKQPILSVLNSLGAIQWGYGNYNKALYYYNKALEIALSKGNNSKRALITVNIGLVYHEWGKDKEAMEHYFEGLEIAKKENDSYSLAYAYSNIGTIYLQNGEYEKSLVQFDSALVHYKKISKKLGVAFSYRNMGDSYFEAKNLEKAISYYKLSVKTAREVDSKHHMALGLYALSKAYFQNKSYQLAENAAIKSARISTAQKYHAILKDDYFLLSKIAEKSGLTKIAFNYYKNANNLKDSIFNEKSSKQFAEMQTKYETEKKELLLEKQQEKIEKNQIIIEQDKIQKYGLSLIIFLLFVSTYLGIKAKNKIKQKNVILKEKFLELKEKKIEIEEINRELTELTKLKELNTQMIVHDLKNPLNRIISTSKKKKTEAERKLYESSQYMLNLVENILSVAKIEQTGLSISTTAINLEETILDAYENTEFLFKNKGILFERHIPVNYKILAENDILKRIFTNLFTNAAKHTASGGKVSVTVKKNKKFAFIEVKDTGIGIKMEKIGKIFDIYEQDYHLAEERVNSTGIGLYFVKNAVEALGGEIHVKSKPNIGTNFIIKLKIIELVNKTETTVNPNNNKHIQLDTKDKEVLADTIYELENTELYEVTKIKNILSQVNANTNNLKIWLKLADECVANYNTDLFQKLIINAKI